jgi:predicted nucleic acid-binding protein
MVVIDTNVLAYLLIEGDRTAQAQALYAHDGDWRSEAFLLIEFSNLLATCVRGRRLDGGAAKGLLADAERTLAATVSLPHSRVLEVAIAYGVSAYDARFLAAAQVMDAKLVTEDTKLQQAAPALTHSLAQAIAGS